MDIFGLTEKWQSILLIAVSSHLSSAYNKPAFILKVWVWSHSQERRRINKKPCSFVALTQVVEGQDNCVFPEKAETLICVKLFAVSPIKTHNNMNPLEVTERLGTQAPSCLESAQFSFTRPPHNDLHWSTWPGLIALYLCLSKCLLCEIWQSIMFWIHVQLFTQECLNNDLSQTLIKVLMSRLSELNQLWYDCIER